MSNNSKVCEFCGIPFERKHNGQKFCNDSCRKKSKNERYSAKLASDPKFRAKRNDKSRAWRDGNRDHIKKYNALRFIDEPEIMRAAINASQKSHPERHAARKAVQFAIRTGKLARITTLSCAVCGTHPAANYHHHNGYDAAHKLDVIPLCTVCHGRAHWKE